MALTQTRDETKARLHDTRQLLDELDALMDQMLALPITDEDEIAPETAEPVAPAPATVSATLTMLESPARRQPAPAESSQPRVADVAAESISEPTEPVREWGGEWGGETDETPAAPPTIDEPAPVPVLADVAAPKRVELAPLPPPVRTSLWRPDHISYQFLLWINQGYDGGMRRLGMPGRMLVSRAAKALLGLVGLGLLGVAAAWLARDWLGWNW
ncbi:MAG: hypothetical protein L0Y71_05365 [Gemmataceae bacterium]|nr:hypothetical protein [Gemmataceae bacterium]